MAKVWVINSGGVRERVLGKRRGDRAKDVVETATLDIEAGHGPGPLAGKPGDGVRNRLPVPGENAKAGLAVIGGYLDRGDAGPLAQLGGNRGGIAGSEIEAHGVMVARAGGELRRRTVGKDAAAGDDDSAAAPRLDLLQEMRRDDDRLMWAQLANDAAHLIFLVRVEPVGRLIEDQHGRIVQQGLRDPDRSEERRGGAECRSRWAAE